MAGLARAGAFRRNVTWQAVSTIVGAAASFAYSLVVARWLGPTLFGDMSVALAFATVVSQLVELRLNEPVVKFLVEYHEAQDRAGAIELLELSFAADLASGVLAFAMTFAVGWLGNLVAPGKFPTGPVMALAAGYLLAWNAVTNTSNAVLRALDDVKPLSIVSVAQSVAKLAVTFVGLACLGWSVQGVLVVAVILATLANVVTFLLAVRRVRRAFDEPARRQLARPRERVRELVAFTRNAYLVNLTQLPLRDLDVALVGALVPASEVGSYRIAKNFSIAANLIFDPVYYAVYPELSRLFAQGDRDALDRFIRRISKLLALTATVVCGVGALVTPLALRILFGGKYDGAVPIFYAMLPGVLLWAPLVWVPGLLLAGGRSDLSLRAAVLGAVAVGALYLVLVPTLGTIGAALAVGPGGTIVTWLSLYMARAAGLLGRSAGTTNGGTS